MGSTNTFVLLRVAIEYPLDPLPRDHPDRMPTIESDESCGACDLCGGDVYLYEPKDAFPVVPRHWSCSKRAGLFAEREIGTNGQTPEQAAYAAQLRGIKAGTLAAMVNEYDERPAERLPEHEWQIALVRLELGSR